ncbi:MAG: sensor domain-containing diguanylate cyclase [gamma proteobacterium symbiont of Taylorina sp.]|nr:sensor domain-containing diguanylate cyclase [gamma proteobacterium symbiont of Taylorina sp.]
MSKFKNIGSVQSKENKDNNDYDELKTEFNSFLINAHDNQQKLDRFEKIEFKLMAAESINDVLLILRDDYLKLFNLDSSSLVLDDHDLSIQKLIPDEFHKKSKKKFLSLFHTPMDLNKLQFLPEKITTGAYQSIKHRWLMYNPEIKSIAILPLIRRGKTIGIFCCGSNDPLRFQVHAGCDFLQRLSFIMAVCIENALNLEILKQSSLMDPLTQVHNRRFFDQRLPEELTRRDRNHAAISCIFLDIDLFKSVNDNYGHGVGDDVLCQVAKRIQTVLRTHDILARYGGEEFVALLPETPNEEALLVAQRIVAAVNKTPVAIGKNVILKISLSAGVSTLMTNDCYEDIQELGRKLLSTADQALYDAKEQGRNRAINAGLLVLSDVAQCSSM